MDEAFLFGVLRSVLGGRGKVSRKALRHLTGARGSLWTHPTTLLTAAGVAWGIYETLQQRPPGASPGSGAPAASPVAPPPLPATGSPTAADSDVLRMVRLVIAAANADGVVGDRERAAILEQARAAGVGDVVEQELAIRRPLAEIVAGVGDPARRATLYVLAYTILRADEQVSGAERIFLAQLAHLLGLDPATVEKLEADTSARIDAASAARPA